MSGHYKTWEFCKLNRNIINLTLLTTGNDIHLDWAALDVLHRLVPYCSETACSLSKPPTFDVPGHIRQAVLALSRLRMPLIDSDVQNSRVTVDGRNFLRAKPESLMVDHRYPIARSLVCTSCQPAFTFRLRPVEINECPVSGSTMFDLRIK
jgi:hypothetical protein